MILSKSEGSWETSELPCWSHLFAGFNRGWRDGAIDGGLCAVVGAAVLRHRSDGYEPLGLMALDGLVGGGIIGAGAGLMASALIRGCESADTRGQGIIAAGTRSVGAVRWAVNFFIDVSCACAGAALGSAILGAADYDTAVTPRRAVLASLVGAAIFTAGQLAILVVALPFMLGLVAIGLWRYNEGEDVGAVVEAGGAPGAIPHYDDQAELNIAAHHSIGALLAEAFKGTRPAPAANQPPA